jgi:putative copper resistance protein D
MTLDGWAVAILLARVALYAGAALSAGGALHALLLGPAPGASRRSVIAGAGLALAASLGLVALQAGLLAGRGPAGMADPAMLRLVLESPWGESLAARASGLALLAAALAGPAAWRAAGTAAGAAAVAWSFSRVGHASGDAARQAALTLHLLAVLFWAGSLWPLALTAWRDPPGRAADRAERFGALAMAAVAALLLAGGVLAALLLGSLAALGGTDYGLALALKAALAAGALAFGARHRLALVPALRAGAPGAGPRLARSIGLETGLIGGVLLATAALTTVMTPP